METEVGYVDKKAEFYVRYYLFLGYTIEEIDTYAFIRIIHDKVYDAYVLRYQRMKPTFSIADRVNHFISTFKHLLKRKQAIKDILKD
jgi:hypothetical protein